MAQYLGLDWASKGWFGVVLDDDGLVRTDLYPSIWSVWETHSDATRIMIDIPIGLPADKRRRCDVAAKRRLGTYHRRVFYAPVRAALSEPNLEAAKAINERAGFSIQNQAWSVVPRIREVDEFLQARPAAREVVAETHPELCFYGLAGGAPIASPKDTAEGRERRLKLLGEGDLDAEAIYTEAVEQFTTPTYAPLVSDEADILDALAAAVTARRPAAARSTLPGEYIPRDETGLPMRIIYPDATEQLELDAISST